MKTIYCLIGFAGRYEFEALTDREFCDRHGISGDYDEWVANGGEIDDVMDCGDKDEAILCLSDLFNCNQIEESDYAFLKEQILAA